MAKSVVAPFRVGNSSITGRLAAHKPNAEKSNFNVDAATEFHS
ncbi:hypothetical protein [Snodgrassella sp. B3882]|nr:hypothetical protein [Snodgrassella sp. B3882]